MRVSPDMEMTQMGKATREDLKAALSRYLDAREVATLGCCESTPEWDALESAYNHLQVVERSFHARTSHV